MNAYDEIERRTTFRIPDLYRRMCKDGVCNYAGSPQEWQSVWRRRALENPPALLGALDFEWLGLDEMMSWSPPDDWLPEHLFVPFGQTGAGDCYAWYPAWAEGDSVPVVLAWHDDNRCECLAPHLEGFLYRQTLEALTYVDPRRAQRRGFTSDEARQALRANIDVLRPYLRPSWMADLDGLSAREPREWSRKLPRTLETFVSQLGERELEERLSRELSFSKLNAEFDHMKP